MRRVLIILLLFLLFVISDIAFAANHFIRPGPNGGNYGREDGSDWNNAFDGFPETMIRGDTYYIAGGDYDMGKYGAANNETYIFDDPEDGNTYIYIKKASVDGIADQTPGWNPDFANNQAVIHNSTDAMYQRALYLTKGYYKFDGVTGSGNSGHGILVTTDDSVIPTPGKGRLFLVFLDGANYVTFRHIKFKGYSLEEADNVGISDSIVLIYNKEPASNVTIQSCYLKGANVDVMIGYDSSDGWLIEHCYFEDTWGGGPASIHAETINLIMSDNHIIRYNIFDNAVNSTGGIAAHGQLFRGDAYLPENGGGVDNIEIYGNVFFKGSGSFLIGTASSACSVGMNNWKIYNNTVVGASSKIYVPIRTNCHTVPEYENTWPASGWEVKNNLFYGGGGGVPTETGVTYAYNYYNNMANQKAIPINCTNCIESNESLSDLFHDYSSNDFRLKASSEAFKAGTDIGKPYNIDIIGTTRPQGKWDMGAYEYLLTHPENLRIISHD
jgi:hypothetical protein